MLRIVFIFLGLSLTTLSFAQEPTNLSSLKDELKHYHDSGEYAKDINQVVSQAQSYLQERIDSNKQQSTPEKLAIVLDIDETSISNYTLISQYDFNNSLENGFPAHLLKYREAKAIKPTLELAQLAINNNVAVFFITGRPTFFRQVTVESLQKTGFTSWEKVFFKPEDYQQTSISVYKTSIRKKITDQGYNIVVNMGDQCSDLNGGYAEQTYKLPDPYYFIP